MTEKASFIDDLGADSLDNVELVMAFEEEFDVEIPDDAAEHIQTVGDAVKFISGAAGRVIQPDRLRGSSRPVLHGRIARLYGSYLSAKESRAFGSFRRRSLRNASRRHNRP